MTSLLNDWWMSKPRTPIPNIWTMVPRMGRSHKSLKRSSWSSLPHTPSQALSRIQPSYRPLKASYSLYVYQSPSEASFKCLTFKSSHDSRPQGAFPFLTSNQYLLPFIQQRHIEQAPATGTAWCGKIWKRQRAYSREQFLPRENM